MSNKQVFTLKEKIKAKQPVANALRAKADEASSKAKAVEDEIRRAEQELHVIRCEGFMKRLSEDPELIDILAPSHSRSSCDDDNHGNASRGCSRCRLLDIKAEGYIDPASAHFEFRV